MINVKTDFANWILQNAPDSYTQYLGGSVQSVKERLSEINHYFQDFNFFEIDESNIDSKIREIQFLLSTKERKKVPDFLEYDKHHSNGIPKAVMGKNNYLKFLVEKFSENNSIKYWIFQGNPNWYDYENALKDNSLNFWWIKNHKDKVKIGDKVILWITGGQSGCYALGEISGEVKRRFLDENQKNYFLNDQRPESAESIGLKITHNLIKNPVLWNTIKGENSFSSFKGGSQGTNFTATKEEYEFILGLSKTNKFSWVKTHKEIVKYLLDKEDQQTELIDLLKSVGIGPFDNDEDEDGNKIDLSEIDPFTFFFFIYKYGSKRRLDYLQKLANKLTVFVPNDDSGIPSAQAQKVWLFPYLATRKNNEIKRLWDLFKAALEDSITDQQFADVLTIRSSGKTKLTEGLFEVDPEKYFPINGPTKPYLKEVLNIDPKFDSFTEYKNILTQIRGKSDKPFYELSYEAWKWNSKKSENSFQIALSKFPQDELNVFFKFLFETVDHLKLNEGDVRVVYSCGGKYLNFNIGQRFTWRLNKQKSKRFQLMTQDKLDERFKPYDGPPDHYYFTPSDPEEIEQVKPSAFSAFELELNRSHKSGFRKSNNPDFEKAVFDKDFRKKYVTQEKSIPMSKNLNTILYGPPGTGKTYNTINKAVSIANPEFDLNQDRSMIKNEYDRLLEEGQIAFTTFHQSMSYEDFVEGIKPVYNSDTDDNETEESVSDQLSYKIEKGIFRKICDRASTKKVVVNDFDSLWNQFILKLFDSDSEVIFKSVESELKYEPELSDDNSIVVRYKKSWNKEEPEGTQTFKITKYIIKKLWDAQVNGADDNPNGRKDVAEVLGSGRATHTYAVYKNFYMLADSMGSFEEAKERNLVLIVDEINRGNISSAFGELITLIEEDKREGQKEEIEVILPYSKLPFKVPANVYIIGTMNTADRSVEALDTALRRRFSFEEMPPKPSLIKTEGQLNNGILEGIDLSLLLTIINQRIERLVDKDHMIGHSYFLSIKNMEDLMNTFHNRIIPLLQEYFFGDYGKIGLVIGAGFFEESNNDLDDTFFADFDYDSNSFFEKEVYHLKNVVEMSSKDFKDAIQQLLNRS